MLALSNPSQHNSSPAHFEEEPELLPSPMLEVVVLPHLVQQVSHAQRERRLRKNVHVC